jgi:uncharacterized protein YhfF
MAGFLLPRLVLMSFPRAEGLRTIEFGNPGEQRQRLIDYVVKGNKRATAGILASDYEAEGEPIEFVGERLAVINNDESVAAIVEVTRCEVVRFADVPDEFALAEAEGDLSGDDFRNSHFEYWTSCGEVITDDTEIVTTYFDLIEIR